VQLGIRTSGPATVRLLPAVRGKRRDLPCRGSQVRGTRFFCCTPCRCQGRQGHTSASRHVGSTVRLCWPPVAHQRRDGAHAPIDRSAVLVGQDDQTVRTGVDLQRFTDEDEAVPCASGVELRAARSVGPRTSTGSCGPATARHRLRQDFPRYGGGLHVRQAREDNHRLTTQPTARVRSSRTGAPAARWDQLRGRCRSARELVPR
jgi:hypothetical protein